MVVKEKIGRVRYVAFKNSIKTDRKEMNHILYSLLKEKNISFRLTIFDGEYGIIKIKHWDKNKILESLNESSEIMTLKTSGTIKKAKKMLDFELNNDKYM